MMPQPRSHPRDASTDDVGRVFAALADPTRRSVVAALLRDGTTSVPTLTDDLPISRQAVAKHLAALGARLAVVHCLISHMAEPRTRRVPCGA